MLRISPRLGQVLFLGRSLGLDMSDSGRMVWCRGADTEGCGLSGLSGVVFR